MNNLNELIAGKSPPQCPEAEQAVLGCMLQNAECVHGLVAKLKPTDFCQQVHALVYAAILSVYDAGLPVDTISVFKELQTFGKLDEIGGAEALANLTECVPSVENATHYGRLVLEASHRRSLITASSRSLQAAYDDSKSLGEVLTIASESIAAVTMRSDADQCEAVGDVTRAVFKAADAANNKTTPHMITGLTHIDFYVGHFKPGHYVLIAARPSVGKTSLMLCMARKLCEDGFPGLIFTLEMTKAQLTQNLMCIVSGIEGTKIDRGLMTDTEYERLAEAGAVVASWPLYIDDYSRTDIRHIRSLSRRYRLDKGIRWIAIDYLHLMDKPKAENETMRLAELSRALKGLAQELDMPVFALSQLNRGAEYRKDHRPITGDLRGSGALEQDADVIILLHRSWMYSHNAEEAHDAEACVAKNRGGPTGVARLDFDGPTFTFSDKM